jgi:hypothetical protein
MQITMIVLIVAIGIIIGLTGADGGGFLTTFLAAFGLFVIVVLGAAMVFVKKRNANK